MNDAGTASRPLGSSMCGRTPGVFPPRRLNSTAMLQPRNRISPRLGLALQPRISLNRERPSCRAMAAEPLHSARTCSPRGFSPRGPLRRAQVQFLSGAAAAYWPLRRRTPREPARRADLIRAIPFAARRPVPMWPSWPAHLSRTPHGALSRFSPGRRARPHYSLPVPAAIARGSNRAIRSAAQS